eukprot:Phypoly_transcript_01793.p1 GENE.Phypoly_transcript_01793~~Phypoly_transcript_01793.p1  ORF type:complete len:830 (+),score=216.17 Phypoly_transcript_01793:123-2612(+)
MDDDYEKFNVDNDYEGGQWIGGEFFYENKVKKRKFTKDDAVYGIFNDGSSSDEGGSRKSKRSDKNLNRPVAFVSTGKILQGDKKDQPEEEEEEEEDDDVMRGFEIGAGLGSQKKKKKKKPKNVEADLPASFGSSKTKKGKYDPYLGGPPPPEPDQPVEDMSKFNKYGIGSKLLAKMGYKGGGLGATGQGIVEPVAVKQRPKGLALGNMDEKTEQQKQHERRLKQEQQAKEIAEESEESEEDETQPKSWKKGAAPRRKPKTVYEVLNQEEEARPQKILDMRGPQPRIVTSAADAGAHDAKKHAGPLPELRFNLRLLVDLAEVKIQNADRREKQEKDRMVVLENERERMEDQVGAELKRIERLQEVLEIIAKCQDKVKAGDMHIDYMKKIFSMMKNKYKEEYVMHRLKYVAAELVGPLLKSYMATWDPLVEPTYGADVFGTWREILEEDTPTDYSDDQDYDINGYVRRDHGETTPYMQLVMDVFMAKLRSWMSNSWNVRNYEPVIQIIASWGIVLPPAVLDNILDQLVMPKLTREVENWDPRTDVVPIHAWLHPWLPILGARMDLLYPPIRTKLAAALRDWHASDPSAHALIQPWINVFDQASMEALLVRAVMPKLIMALREFVINPLQQEIVTFENVMLWADMIPLHHFVQMLDSEFFLKWINVLYAWLASRPDYEEVSRWYLGWKKLFPQNILNHDRVRTYFNLALEAMNLAITGNIIPANFAPPPPMAYVYQAPPPPTMYTPPPPPAVRPPPPPSDDDMNLKQVVESLAMQHNLTFLPSRRRHENGSQIYAFGNIPVYLEKGRVCVQEGSAWVPISADALVAKAQVDR